MTSRKGALLSFAAVALFLASCTGACDSGCGGDTTLPSKAIARCEEERGDVRTHPPNGVTWSPLPTGAELSAGDWIQTAAGAWARIDFFNGSRLEIESSSVVVLEEPSDAKGDSAIGLVALRSGRLRGVIGPDAPRRELMVKTPGGKNLRIARVPSGGALDYRIAASESGDIELSVNRGQATIEADGTVVTLAGGQKQKMSAGRLSGQVIVLPVPPAQIAPAEGALFSEGPGTEVRLSWISVPGAVRYRLEIADDPGFGHVVASPSTAETSYEFEPKKATIYAWRVAAIDQDGNESEQSPGLRFSIEEPAPDALLYPPDGAMIAFAGGQPLVTFSWRATPDPAATYEVVVAAGRDLSGAVQLDQRTEATLLKTRDLGQGDYVWGVYLVSGDKKSPLFPKPHRLSLKRNDSGIQLPKKLKWE